MNTLLVFGHILGAVAWAGGVFFIGVVAASSRHTVSERERVELFRVLGRRFLWTAAGAAVLLAVTGNAMADRFFGGWDAIAGETRDLVVWKTVLFALVLVLAAIHGLGLGPRIRELRLRALDGGAGDEDAATLKRLRILSVATEVLMLAGTVAILALAADLVS